MKKRICCLLSALLLLLSGGCAPQTATPSTEQAVTPLCGVWVAYPQVEALLQTGDAEAVRAAIASLMEDCAARGLNTVFWHVRANSDAYYRSTVFEANDAAKPLLEEGFDPLRCAVEEAHARGLALHAWINPYRIGTQESRARTDAYFCADGRYYYVPTDTSVRALIVAGVRELVEGYDIDGVQFDDYFYPSGAVESEQPATFETAAYAAFTAQGGDLALADWRRAAVSRLIAAVYSVCHGRAGCVFGVSPAYDREHDRERLYADVTRWLAEAGYVDYLCPQLYVGFENETAPFEQALADWHDCARADGVALYAGLALYKAGAFTDEFAGSGSGEWAAGGNILARQWQAVQAAGFDGAALYAYASFTAFDGRDEAVAQAEIASLQQAMAA